MNKSTGSRSEAQVLADRIRILREELHNLEEARILELTPDQRARIDEWSSAKLGELAVQFDVDTSPSQKRLSWGMRIASTLGGAAICAAVVLFFERYWGFFDTPLQVALLIQLPLATLAGTEYAARRERTLYFAGLLGLVALASFILNLVMVGRIFNIVPTENAMLAWGTFALLLAYRYGLRLHLAAGLGFLMSYLSAVVMAGLGYSWHEFATRPEHLAVMGGMVFAMPLRIKHVRHTDFPAVYRLAGELVVLTSILSLSEWGARSYLPFGIPSVEKTYELFGLVICAGTIWLGIKHNWDAVVNVAAIFFGIFLFCRLYHWWWDLLPKYLFFALVGSVGIVLVVVFRRIRTRFRAGETA